MGGVTFSDFFLGPQTASCTIHWMEIQWESKLTLIFLRSQVPGFLLLASLPGPSCDACAALNCGVHFESQVCRVDFGWYMWPCFAVPLEVVKGAKNSGSGLAKI